VPQRDRVLSPAARDVIQGPVNRLGSRGQRERVRSDVARRSRATCRRPGETGV